jgi:hypothetical protein
VPLLTSIITVWTTISAITRDTGDSTAVVRFLDLYGSAGSLNSQIRVTTHARSKSAKTNVTWWKSKHHPYGIVRCGGQPGEAKGGGAIPIAWKRGPNGERIIPGILAKVENRNPLRWARQGREGIHNSDVEQITPCTGQGQHVKGIQTSPVEEGGSELAGEGGMSYLPLC